MLLPQDGCENDIQEPLRINLHRNDIVAQTTSYIMRFEPLSIYINHCERISMKYICFFDDPQAVELARVGGKGTNLGKMANAGFPVPPGYCIMAGAYRYLIEITGLNPIISRKVESIDFQDQSAISETASCIRDLISQQPIPIEIAQEIGTAYERLGDQMGESQMLPVAVRSSATAEDLPDASFAGQQDTYLNICGHSSVLEHVRSCWASLWTARAITYRHNQGYDQHQVFLAVIVQAMVEPQTAGIAFTANPISGNRDQCVINASWGLGEAIVSGIVSPDTYIVSKENGRITQQLIARKERMIISNQEGGSVEVETAAHLRDIPALNKRQVAELTALSSRIEDHYGSPQDIEWANDNGRWYILQSRPITTLTEISQTAAIQGTYSRAMFVEIFPEAISPSFLSVVSPLLANMLNFTFQQLGMSIPDDIEAVRDFNNQPYFNVDYIEASFSSVPPADRQHLVAQFTNPISHNEGSQQLSLAQLKLLVRMLRYLRRFRRELPELISNFRREIKALELLSLDSLADQKILSHIRAIVFQNTSRLLNGDFLLIALAGTFNRFTLRILQRYYREEAPEIFNGLITGVTGNVIMETNKLLWNLAQEARTTPHVKEALLLQDPQKTLSKLKDTTAGLQFLEQMDAVLDICGHREMHLDILYPTWREDPAPVLAYIRGYLKNDSQQNPAERQLLLVEKRNNLTASALALMKRDIAGRLLFAPLFRWLLSQIHHLLRERDTMHFEWTRLFPPARKLLLELGRRWTERSLLKLPEDVFYLRLKEMEQIILTPEPQHDLIAVRREELAANLHGPWPDIMKDGQEIFRETVEYDNGRLHGVAGSPGSVTGPCRIIHNPQEFGRLESGDILVAPLTNPVWTPLFAIAAGLVTDVGGILSHGAIVAREYGIPAVMSVNGATSHLVDGQIITVNGDKGKVIMTHTNGAG